ncbi:telomere zinc finger-associated protein isoform X2 [Protopterus annectens]|uniref:telomere zinc finger-associated protein isoform X2 n=1 Tax=Protopterus annectens TaxID=7888 RepID=UPI001CFA56E4|nr:telomere zinc finger-associated protein isoform X2 [Protopterus annectens]
MEDHFSNHSKKILLALNRQRIDGRFCDINLEVGSLVFKAHRCVLACCSPFFRGLCGRDGTFQHINLPDSYEGVFEQLLDFVYNGDLLLTGENVDKVLAAAKELGIADVVELCEKFEQRCTKQVVNLHEVSQETLFSEDPNGQWQKHPVFNKAEQNCVILEADAAHHGTVDGVFEVMKECLFGLQQQNTVAVKRGLKRPLRANSIKRLPKEGMRRTPVTNTLTKRHPEEAREIPSRVNTVVSEAEVVHVIEEEIAEENSCIHDEADEDYIPEKDTIKKKRKASKYKKSGSEGAMQILQNLDSEFHPSKKRDGEAVECPTCHKKFFSKYYLKVHNRRHTGERPFECLKCGKCYFRKDNLLEHEAKNCMGRTDRCCSCPQQYMQKRGLQTHMIKAHGAPKPHACSICSKCYLSRTELRLHEASKHRGEKLFVCEECGHRASSRNGLQMHIKAKHRNERPFVCEFCNHAFTQKANLNMHRRTHTGEKPFQCHLCGKTFRTQASLDKHNRTHTGERPFSCEFCDQRFTERGPLLRHVASKHQEGRPHYCQICGKTFKAIEQLRVHVRRHKGVRKFECSECNYKFTRQAHLRRHMEIHNRVENYNPRQRRLRNLIIDDDKMAVALQKPDEIDDPRANAELIVETLNRSAMTEELPVQRLCVDETFDTADVIEQSLIITTVHITDSNET